MTLSRGSRVGPYEILDLLGQGGMGAVYRARDPRLDRDVAIKVLRADVIGDRTGMLAPHPVAQGPVASWIRRRSSARGAPAPR